MAAGSIGDLPGRSLHETVLDDVAWEVVAVHRRGIIRDAGTQRASNVVVVPMPHVNGASHTF